jgi:hypothetical protein
MTYDCMTPDELALWRASSEGVNVTAKVPCIDCPAWFEAVAREQGCCNRRTAREAPPSEVLRFQWRMAARKYRQRRQLAERNRRYRAKLRSQVEAVRAARAGGTI